MRGEWLLKRLVYLGWLVAVPMGGAVALLRDWNRVPAFLNGNWPPWVSNVVNVFQIGGPIVALAGWITRAARARRTEPGDGTAVRLLRFLALLLPARHRDRFVGEVLTKGPWSSVQEPPGVRRSSLPRQPSIPQPSSMP
jgi:hypothetical protein